MADPAETHWQTIIGRRDVAITEQDRAAATERFEQQYGRPPVRDDAQTMHGLERDAAQNKYNAAIDAAVTAHPVVDAATLKSLLYQESDLNASIGGRNYVGIAQLGAGEARAAGLNVDGGIDERRDPLKAIDAAAATLAAKDRELKRPFERYGEPVGDDRAKFDLASYNGGAGTVAMAMRIAYEDGLTKAHAVGLTGTEAETSARSFATKFDNLLEPKGNVEQSPLYKAADHYLSPLGADPREKYNEIGHYADDIVTRARQDGRQTIPSNVPAPTDADRDLVNTRIAEAAEKMRGMSTRNAQTHHPELENGIVGCAFSVNKVLDTALGRTYGSNPEYVPSVMADLRRNGREIAPADVRPGDIAIKLPSHGEKHGHIGIVTQGGENPKILNNSSSRGSLTNEDTPAQFSRNYVTKRDEDRVVYLRIDPASVDLANVRANPIPERVLGPDNAPPDPTHWTEHRPAAPGRTHSGVGAPAPTQGTHGRSIDDATHRNDLVIHGESKQGVKQETASELEEKNAIVAEAVRDAKQGKTLDYRFVGNGRESAREVALQNEKLEHAIETNLPASAKVELVPLDSHAKPKLEAPQKTLIERASDALVKAETQAEHIAREASKALSDEVKRWTPDMDFEQFAKLMGKVRGGQSPEAPKAPVKAVERTPNRSDGLGH